MIFWTILTYYLPYIKPNITAMNMSTPVKCYVLIVGRITEDDGTKDLTEVLIIGQD